MTDDRQLSVAIEHWLDEGPIQMPERVFDTVADRIARQPQRPAWRLDWRLPQMNLTLKLATATAAVVVAAVIGYNLLPGTSTGIGGPAPTATPVPTATPAPTATLPPSPSTAPSPDIPVMLPGSLAAGTYQTEPFGSVPGFVVTFTVPAGWQGFQTWAILGPNGTGAPNGIGVGWLNVDGVFRDACHWDQNGSGSYTQAGGVVVGPTVDELVAALRANKSYTTSTPIPVVLDGHAGQRIDIRMPTDLDPTTCDKGFGDTTGVYYVFSGASGDGGLYAQGPGQIFHDWIIDVGGQRVVVGYNDYATTPAADRAAAEAIIGSMQFSR